MAENPCPRERESADGSTLDRGYTQSPLQPPGRTRSSSRSARPEAHARGCLKTDRSSPHCIQPRSDRWASAAAAATPFAGQVLSGSCWGSHSQPIRVLRILASPFDASIVWIGATGSCIQAKWKDRGLIPDAAWKNSEGNGQSKGPPWIYIRRPESSRE